MLKDLNISKNQWRKYSESEKDIYRSYYLKQEEIKKRIVRKRYPPSISNLDYKKELIKAEVEKEWENFSLEERIEIIDKDEFQKQEKKKKREEENRKFNEECKKIILETKKIEQEIKEIEEKRKPYLLEQEKLKKREEERLKVRKNEEIKKREKEEKEEQKRIEVIKREKLLETRKEQENEKHKEYVKQQIRKKEKRKHIASEAIEEMIESGELSENFSSNRKRETIPSHIREAVWIRDKESCVTCGSRESLEFDHIIPVSKGGSNSINNIQLLCLKCNRSKSNKIM